MASVLFDCLHNAGRSQMSAALFERAARGHHRALSAGSEADRGGHVHPEVVQVMRELGIERTEERRGGEGGRDRWGADHLKKKKKKTRNAQRRIIQAWIRVGCVHAWVGE